MKNRGKKFLAIFLVSLALFGTFSVVVQGWTAWQAISVGTLRGSERGRRTDTHVQAESIGNCLGSRCAESMPIIWQRPNRDSAFRQQNGVWRMPNVVSTNSQLRMSQATNDSIWAANLR